jgi:large subunit ribosomal protein L25
VTDILLEVERRTDVGARAAKRLRDSGSLPSVVYAKGAPALSCTLSHKEFVRIAKSSRISTVFTLKSSDSELNGRLAIVKEIQKEGLSGKVLHVDFQSLLENEEITVRVPLNITGEAAGVKLDGGILTISAHDISVRCLPKQIPQVLELDVSDVKLGGSVHAEDLKLPAGVRLSGNPQETIASVVAVRQVVEEVAPAVEGAAPAAGAAAPGAAPAAGAEGAKAAEPAAAAKPAKK